MIKIMVIIPLQEMSFCSSGSWSCPLWTCKPFMARLVPIVIKLILTKFQNKSEIDFASKSWNLFQTISFSCRFVEAFNLELAKLSAAFPQHLFHILHIYFLRGKNSQKVLQINAIFQCSVAVARLLKWKLFENRLGWSQHILYNLTFFLVNCWQL